MKKFFSVCLFLCTVFTIAHAGVVYLNTGGSTLWNQGEAKFAVYCWNTDKDGVFSDFMTVTGNPNVFQATIPDDKSHLIYVRCSNTASKPSWENKWNQTSDLSVPTDNKNCYEITGWGGDNQPDKGKWTTLPDPPVPCFGIQKGDGTYVRGVINPNYIGEGVEYMILGVALQADETFVLRDSCNMASWTEPLDEASTMCIVYGDNHYTATEAGRYDIYLKMKGMGDNVVFVGCNSCSQHGAVPAQYPGVMLQGFYYDSYEVDPEKHNGTEIYGDTRWTTLQRQASEIGAYFDLVWLPPSGCASGTGYHPRQYSNQNSDWGSRAELQELIKSFHAAKTKVLADIVINHIEAMASWCDFSVQNFGKYGTYIPDGSWICKTDEMNWIQYKADTLAGECWGTATGNDDDGENWEGARDWSHDLPKVQEMFKAYELWLKNEIGYDGWRYDKGDGFNNWHMWNYNRASNPDFAVMECWKGNNDIKWHIDQSKKDVAAFDFQNMYHVFNNGIANNNFGNCGVNGKEDWGDGAGLVQEGYKRNAVTFIDNHDMFLRDNQEFCGYGNSMKPENKNKLLQANAYLLSMPGTPCVFYPHWVIHKEALKDMINARHVAGVHSESDVKEEEVSQTGYKATVVGKNGYLIITLGDKTIQNATGSNKWLADNGYHKLASGTGYAIWVTVNQAVAGHLIATQDCSFEDSVSGITVGMSAVGGFGQSVIYYTTDGTDPTEESTVYTDSLTFTTTTTLKAMVITDSVKSDIYTYTYTYREPLKRGIQVHFQKPDIWKEVYYYAWIAGTDSAGEPTSENIMGAYPGQRIYRDQDGWYTYEFDLSLDSVQFCISSGDRCGELNVRSNDLKVDYDAYFTWEVGFEEDDKHELKLEEPIDLHPEFDLEISPESGNFRSLADGQKVTLTVLGRPGAIIYYTTDGSDPSTCANPAKDTVSFVVKNTSVVQAYAFDLESKESTEIRTATYLYKAPQQGAMTVKYFKPKSWKKVYLYAFTRVKVGTKYKDTAYPLNGLSKNAKWPGMQWTTFTTQLNEMTGVLDSVYEFTMPDDMKEIYVIFNIGSNKEQTQDIYLTEDMCYVWNTDCRKAVENDGCTGVVPMPTDVERTEVRLPNSDGKFMMGDCLFIKVKDQIYDILGRKQ